MAIAAVASQNVGTFALANAVSQAFPANVSAGSLIVVKGMQRELSGSASAFVAADCTQTAGTAVLGTIALDAQTELDLNPTFNLRSRTGIWSAIVTTAGTCTMQVSNASANDTHIHIHEFTGSWDSTRLEASNTATQTTNDTTSANTGNGTSAGGALFIGALHTADGSTVTITDEAAFSRIAQTADNGTGNSYGSSQFRIVTTGTTDEGQWALSANNQGWSCSLAVYREVVAAAAPFLPFYSKRDNVLLRM